MHDGKVLTDQQALALPGETPSCVEAPMMGFQAVPSDTTPGNFAQTVNGNYGFATSKLNLYPVGDPNDPAPKLDLPLYANLRTAGYPDQPLVADDYLVTVDIPQNPVDKKPMYQVTKEEDVNIFGGDEFLPQENFPPSPGQAVSPPPGAQPKPKAPPTQSPGIWSDCAGPMHTVHVTNAAFLNGGGSAFEGMQKPLCDSKLVTVRTGQSTSPNFNLFTPVPLPTHFYGLTINDRGLSHDKRSMQYGEAQPLPGVPMGIYDWSGRLVDTVDTDPNGFYEALEPSTSTYNCPLPAGPCPNMYRFVGNDPGQPGHVNPNYNPRFRTIATNFQAWPGLYTVTDTAPTQVATVAISPGSDLISPVVCDPPATQPQLFRVDRPYISLNDNNRTITITGRGFGAAAGQVTLLPDGFDTPVGQQVTAWSETSITFQADFLPGGPAKLAVRTAGGQSTTNGLTLQLLGVGPAGTSGNPNLFEVKPGGGYPTVQSAVEAASRADGVSLVVVWPGAPAQDNPTGAYFENLVLHSTVRLQGVGPGGFQADNSYVPGSVLNGLGFNPDNDRGAAWFDLVGGIAYQGPANVPDAAVITVLSTEGNVNDGSTIDGFTITGGEQSNFPVNLNVVNGGNKTPVGAPGSAITQGGGVYVHAEVDNLGISDNVIVGNGGSYGGAIRVGTPYAPNIHNRNLFPQPDPGQRRYQPGWRDRVVRWH